MKRILNLRGLFAFPLLLIMLSGCFGNPFSAPEPTPTPIAFSSYDLQIPGAALSSKVVGQLPDATAMHVLILFKLNQSQQSQLQKVDATNQQDLQKEANKLGITDAQFAQIKGYLSQQHVSVTLNKLHTSVSTDGTAKAFSQIFQTKFVIHEYQGRQFFAPATSPKLPTFMLPSIVSITGLDSYSAPVQTGATMKTTSLDFSKSTSADCQTPPGSLNPSDVSKLYGFDPFIQHGYTGKGMTIILIEIDGVNQTDIANYAACAGYRGTVDIKTIGNKVPAVEGETTLDMDMIMGLAPDVHIIDYQTADASAQGLAQVLQQVVNDNTKASPGSIISMSLGAAENFSTKTYLDGVDQLLQTLNTEHFSVFVSSGDCAAFADHVWDSVSVSFPASDPNVISVGGTALETDTQENRLSETVWSDSSNQSKCTNQWGSGGGNSNYFTQPTYQKGQGVSNSDSRGFRQVPDVAAVAFDLPVYLNGSWQIVGGTSAAAPIWAAGMSLVNQALIQNKHFFYNGPVVPYYVATHSSQAFTDITTGSNIAFPATSGWDFATGWGSPNFLAYYQVLLNVKS